VTPTRATTTRLPADDEQDTLVRLRTHEQELSRRLEEARRAAEARIFEAREAAARADTLAEADCREEVARLRIERAHQLGAALDGVRAEATQQTLTLARHAAANRERVLARLLTVVIGGGPP
jgi:vacuolar-type H+-ATPase subunit H